VGLSYNGAENATLMALETRKPGGAKYLYLSHRDPATGQVKKVYLGRGPKADAAAAELEARRKRRLDERLAAERLAAELRPAEHVMAALDAAATLLMEASLLVRGYHRANYSRWRKRRTKDGHGQ
jgi:hypothetical protein